MNIRVTNGQNAEGQAALEIVVDGKCRIDTFPGKPEDGSLGRDMSFVYEIIPLMREAYQAGKIGALFLLEEVEEE